MIYLYLLKKNSFFDLIVAFQPLISQKFVDRLQVLFYRSHHAFKFGILLVYELCQSSKRYLTIYRRLNEQLIDDMYTNTNIQDIIDHLGQVKYFTTLDLASGFYQIPLVPEDLQKTVFSTHKGHFEYARMPFGLRNAPSVFQRIVYISPVGLVGN